MQFGLKLLPGVLESVHDSRVLSSKFTCYYILEYVCSLVSTFLFNVAAMVAAAGAAAVSASSSVSTAHPPPSES